MRGCCAGSGEPMCTLPRERGSKAVMPIWKPEYGAFVAAVVVVVHQLEAGLAVRLQAGIGETIES